MPNIEFVLLLLVPALGASGCNIVPTNHSSNPTANFFAVQDGLIYRGARPSYAALEELMTMQGVHTILNLENDDDAVAQEKKWAQQLGLKEVVASMNGLESPSNETVTLALDTLIDATNMPVYVHCTKGEDRTGVIIALHRVFNQGWDASAARNEMEAHGFDGALLALKKYFEKKVGLD